MTRGLCSACYNKHAAIGWQEPAPTKRPGRRGARGFAASIPAVCLSCGETKPHYGKGLCRKCYRHGYEGPVRVCSGCRQDKPHFALDMCQSCYSKTNAKYYEKERCKRRAALPEAEKERLRQHHRSYRMHRLYGLTLAQAAERLKGQGDSCAICLSALSDKTMHIDHCHRTGATRGLLCHKCNIGLGHFDDEPGRMERAISYIQHHKALAQET